MDRQWIINYLRKALDLLAKADIASDLETTIASGQQHDERLQYIRHVVKQVAPRLVRSPVEAARNQAHLGRTKTAIEQAIYALEGGQDVVRRLGAPPGPTLRADSLHPMVWDAATSYWRSNHWSQAVEQVAKSVNAALQDRLGRRSTGAARLQRSEWRVVTTVIA